MLNHDKNINHIICQEKQENNLCHIAQHSYNCVHSYSCLNLHEFLARMFKMSIGTNQNVIWHLSKFGLILWNTLSRALPVCSWSLLMSSSTPLLPLTAALLLFCHQMALLVKRMVRLDCVLFQIITGVHPPPLSSHVPPVSPSKSPQWLLWTCMDFLCMKCNPNVHISFSRICVSRFGVCLIAGEWT